MRRMKWIAVLAIVAATGLAACEQKPEQAPATEQPQQPAAAPAETAPPATVPEGTTAEQVATGKQVFEGVGLCASCHGANAKGTPLAPDLTSGPWIQIDESKGDLLGQIKEVVRNGVPNPVQFPAPMPPMGGAQLTPEQINDVAAYVLSISTAKT